MESCCRFVGGALVAALVLVACADDSKINSTPAYLAANTDVIDFGNVPVGESVERSLFIINKGELPLNVEAPKGDTWGTVFQALTGELQVAPTDSVNVHVVFTPTAAIDYATELTFNNDSANEGEFKLKLLGTGKQKDPCKDKVCNSPPTRFCSDSMTARQFNPVGRCEAGDCKYDPLDETCSSEFGCDVEKGRCGGDPCLGVACQTPPNSCFLAQGLCQRGACIYTANDAGICNDNDPCSVNDRCSQGNCHGTPLDCTGPADQAPKCNGDKLKSWRRTGACNAGACVETEIEVTCTHGCVNTGNQDHCKDDPCAVPYDDGNPCTEEYCDNAGWHTRPKNGLSCLTGNSECQRGTCTAGACLTNGGESCTANVETSLCSDVDVPGTCQGDGRCLPNATPQNDRCHLECPNSIVCLFCEIIPGTGIGITLCL